MKVATTSTNCNFAQKFAQNLGVELIDIFFDKFKNSEKRLRIKSEVGGEKIILVADLSRSCDEMILETLFLADALNRCGAREISLVIPYLSYSLQDKVFLTGESLTSKTVANLFSQSGLFKRIFLFDLHNPSVVGFFSLPTYHLDSLDFFADYVNKNSDQSTRVISSPDFGGLKKARCLAEKLDSKLVYVDKRRDLSSGEVTINDFFGEVSQKNVFILDDIIISGGTAISLTKNLKEAGAKSVSFLATHGLMIDCSRENLENSLIDKIVITNTVEQKNLSNKFEVLDLTEFFIGKFLKLF
jgi:ribose-phosphate pyrophosphokinase